MGRPPRLHVVVHMLAVAMIGLLPQCVFGQGEPLAPPADDSTSRILYLYYYPDADRVVRVLRGESSMPSSPMDADWLKLNAELEETVEARAEAERRLESAAAAAARPNQSPTLAGLLAPAPSPSVADDAQAAGLRAKELLLDRRLFDRRIDQIRAGIIAGDAKSEDPAARVTVAVVGQGMIHLHGPAKGVHRLARMVHQLDRPVGQVKIGLHTIQIELPEGNDLERVHDLIDRHIRHARRLSLRSGEILRQSFSEATQALVHVHDNPQCPASLFCPRFLNAMGRCFRTSDREAATALGESLHSLDLLGSLYLTSLAGDEFRDRVLLRFEQLVQQELVPLEVDYLEALFSEGKENHWHAGMYQGSVPECKGVLDHAKMMAAARRDMTFPNLHRLLRTQKCSETMNSVQSATIALLEVAQRRFDAEQEVASLRRDASIINQMAWLQPSGSRTSKVSLVHPLEQLAVDRSIDEIEVEIVDLDEQLRAAVATVDSQLTQIAMAVEEDIMTQFYQRAMRHIRQASDHWDVRMGQIESTSIITGDRIMARVSPGQTVQLDLPDRPILAKEILDGVETIASETQGLAQRLATRSAAHSAGPGGAILADALGLARAGDQFDQLAPRPNNYRVEVGNEVEITPIIQPDGQSISYRLNYPYSTTVASPPGSGEPARVVRHFVDVQVQSSGYEMKEVSRFRVGVQASRAPRGVPVLEDLPLAGRLFRTRASRANTVRETIILADCVIYPSILSVAGTSWLVPRSHGEDVAHDERSDWNERLVKATRSRLDQLISQEMERIPIDERPQADDAPEPSVIPVSDWHRSSGREKSAPFGRSLPPR